MNHLLHPSNDLIQFDVTPTSANWQYLSYRVLHLRAGQEYRHDTAGDEAALVPIQGAGVAEAGGQRFALSRSNVFREMPHVLYAPPGSAIAIRATEDFHFAIGSAPAEGLYPLRLFRPEEMRSEIRGGGTATRQVNHILTHPLPAERLILFEVYVPGGAWSGYPPHCHDGYGGSAHLDETYHFIIEPDNGFGFHRNYRVDEDFDETFTVHNNDLVLVTKGFHSTTVAAGANMCFLNYLAGELYDEERAIPPLDDPQYVDLKERLAEMPMALPIARENYEPTER